MNTVHFKIRNIKKPLIDVKIKKDKLTYHVHDKNNIPYTILGDEPTIQEITKFVNDQVPKVDNSNLQNLDKIDNLKKPTDNIVITVEKEN